MEKTVVFGGTFNPPHFDHTAMVEALLTLNDVKKILIIPTCVPPHKQSNMLAGNEDRLNMCRLAFGDYPKTEVSDIEIRRGGKSYTVDTLAELKSEGEENIAVVCGGDMIVSFTKWYRFSDILNLAEIIAVRRHGTSEADFCAAVKNLESLGGKVTVIDSAVAGRSSTDIRNNIENGGYLADKLPKKVYDYIKEKGLYR